MKHLVALAAVAVCLVSALDVPMCERDLCACPEPNKFPGDFAKSTNDGNSSCICACGRVMGSACDVTDHCAKGTFCGAPPDITVVVDKEQGVCTDRCAMKKCPAFHKCVINENTGLAECECKKYDCINEVGKSPIHRAERDGRIMNFESMCDAVNANCDLKTADNEAKLWHFVADHSHDFRYGVH